MTDNFYTILAWFVAVPNTLFLMIFALQILVWMFDNKMKLKINGGILIPFILCGISYGWIFR